MKCICGHSAMEHWIKWSGPVSQHGERTNCGKCPCFKFRQAEASEQEKFDAETKAILLLWAREPISKAVM